MKKTNIKEVAITKEMYNRAKEVENIHKKLKELDCRTEEFKKMNDRVIKLEHKFEEEISDEFLTLEIVNEYERREKNTKLLNCQNKKSEVKDMTRKKIAWITNIINVGILTSLVLKNCSPLYGAIACGIAVTTILIAVIPEALTPGIVYNDDFE